MTFDEIISWLDQLENQEKVLFKKKKFGITAINSLGIYHKDLKEMAKAIGKDSKLAIQLFDTGIYEGRILCSMIFPIAELTDELIEKWVNSFETWEICDSFCMGLFAKSIFAIPKILEWSVREKEFEKRAAFTTLAAYCMADKKASNDVFISFLPIIKREATDSRLYVRKAINWALRNIGKRNVDLQREAIHIAEEILSLQSQSAVWIARDAIRQLQREKVNILDYPRSIYRNH